MRNFLLIVLAITTAGVAGADDRERGRQLGKDIRNLYGSGEALEERAFKPLTSAESMQTVDGSKSFSAKVACDAQATFMQVAIAPTGTADVQVVSVEQDRDVDGSRETVDTFVGPFAAVCTNGLLACDPGTTSNCRGRKWAMSGDALIIQDTQADQLGGCYCFNDSCGAGLLTNNSDKVLKDIGLGIANVLDDAYPRLSVGDHAAIDGQTMAFYGQRCASDPLRPEQHYSNPEQLETAGQAAGSDPDSLYYRVTHSSLAQGQVRSEVSCRRERTVRLSNEPDHDAVYTIASHSGELAVESCGPNCREFTLGEVGDNYLHAGCGTHEEYATFTVHRPDKITRVDLVQVTMDDWLSVKFNGTQVYAMPSGWDGSSQQCGENGARGTYNRNDNITSVFQVPAGTSVRWDQRLDWADHGEAYTKIRIRISSCDIGREYIDDNCATPENNASCVLRQETVDGVATWDNYYGTGLAPLPSSRSFSESGCTETVTRDWWRSDRIYSCDGEESEFDGQAAADRYETIHGSFDAQTGDFNDRRRSGEGGYQTFGESMTLPPDDPTGCTKTCKTRRPRAGQAMGDGGALSGSDGENATGVAYDYTYYECEDTTCPAEPGETIVESCNCSSSFFEAFSYMQTIRQAQQDFICQ